MFSPYAPSDVCFEKVLQNDLAEMQSYTWFLNKGCLLFSQSLGCCYKKAIGKQLPLYLNSLSNQSHLLGLFT